MFNLDLLSFSGTTRPGIFDAQPMRRILAELIDFDRLNAGSVRVSIVTVDLACGEEVVFDTATSSINLDHIMASAALIPDFPPVEINGRLYVDGGFIANLPAHIVLDEARAQAEHMTCFVVDLSHRMLRCHSVSCRRRRDRPISRSRAKACGCLRMPSIVGRTSSQEPTCTNSVIRRSMRRRR